MENTGYAASAHVVHGAGLNRVSTAALNELQNHAAITFCGAAEKRECSLALMRKISSGVLSTGWEAPPGAQRPSSRG